MLLRFNIRTIKPDENPPEGGWPPGPTTEAEYEEEELPEGVERLPLPSRRIKIVETAPTPTLTTPKEAQETNPEGIFKALPDPQMVITAIAAILLVLFLTALAVIIALLS